MSDSDRLAMLLRCSQLLTSSLNLQQVLENLMGQVVEAIGAERGLILLRDGPEAPWRVRVAQGLDANALEREDFSISRGLVERVFCDGKSVLTSDALVDDRFKQQASVGLNQLRSILCVPLLVSRRLMGVIYADHRLATNAFDAESRSLLEAIAAQASVALENATLYEENQRLHEEQLAQTREELVQASKLAAIGQLAAGVAHEVNNPLGALLVNLTNLVSFSPDPLYQKRMKLCLGATERCQNIVKNLLTFARGRGGEEELFELSPAVSQTLDLLEADLRLHQIVLQRELSPAISLRANYQALGQILMNLILNARQSLTEVERSPKSIWVRTMGLQGKICLEVVDNGPGMTPEIQERIFEPFFTTKPIGTGVGLGLSMVYRLVQESRGEISVESKPGSGTRFRILFPETGS
ncbi:GAF domain-containing protein [bacterium]|nr:GAF domain-containing protein [bacterium]